MFKDKVVVVTGGVKGIGKEIVRQFEEAGAKVAVIDILDNPYFIGDVGSKADLEAFAKKVIADYAKVDFLINNAIPPTVGLDKATYESFNQALKVGITAPFYLSQLLTPLMPEDSVIINMSSSRQSMSQAQTESYTAAKGGIQALTHSLAVSLAKKKIRVNAIAPGWIQTDNSTLTTEDHQQHLVKRVGQVADIANMVLYLCSDKASFITGQTITIDGGMSKLMIYHGDEGWNYSGE